MSSRRYVVDIWVDDDCVDKDTLDNAIGHALSNMMTQLDLPEFAVQYNLVDMGYE